MFDRFISKSGIRVKFDQTRLNRNAPYTFDNEDPTQLYVTGQCADQLFGTVNFPSSAPVRGPFFPIGASLTQPWHTAHGSAFNDIVEPSIAYSPRPINTLLDLMWWMQINFCWITTLHDDHVGRPAELAKRITSFYSTSDFQTWSANTNTYNVDLDNYRWPARQALAQLIDYPYYLSQKTKVRSITWETPPKWYMMDQDYNNYYLS
jgi:hypothetical protein